jgi:hypothetical protein
LLATALTGKATIDRWKNALEQSQYIAFSLNIRLLICLPESSVSTAANTIQSS